MKPSHDNPKSKNLCLHHLSSGDVRWRYTQTLVAETTFLLTVLRSVVPIAPVRDMVTFCPHKLPLN